jgi:site-specific recombinase XerD
MTGYLTHFTETLRAEGRSENTIGSYLSDLKHFAEWFAQSNGEVFKPEAITPVDVGQYKSYLQTVKGFKPSTINRRLVAIKRLCRWARTQGLIEENPAAEIGGVPRQRTTPKALTRREAARLVRMAQRHGNRRDVAILQLLRHTGIRVGELCDLSLEDLEISDRKGQITVRHGKGGRYREIPLNRDARRALRQYLEVRPKVEDRNLFIGQRGNGLRRAAVYDVVTKYARLASLQDVSPHTLRHTFGKLALDEGENLLTVAHLMGHSRLDTTAIYTQPSRRDLEEAVEKLADPR